MVSLDQSWVTVILTFDTGKVSTPYVIRPVPRTQRSLSLVETERMRLLLKDLERIISSTFWSDLVSLRAPSQVPGSTTVVPFQTNLLRCKPQSDRLPRQFLSGVRQDPVRSL